MKYVWSREQQAFIDCDGKPMETPDRICAPRIQSDMAPYESPLGTGMIEGRRARREDLKRGGCREVDPSEHVMKFTNKSWAKRRGYHVED